MSGSKIGRYEVRGEINRGGMSTIYRAYDPRFDRDVAVKMLPREFLHTQRFRERFEREARAIALLEHPAIVPVYDFGEEDGQPYIVMRFMAGGSLADRLEQGPLSAEEAAQLLHRLAPALDAAHQKGVIHRDLKPGNILFDQYGNAFLSDFGIARMTQIKGPSITGDINLGTPAYMSPERIRGERSEVTARSDIYALGVILYHMLTGVIPFDSDNPTRILMMHVMEAVPNILQRRPDLPPAFNLILQKAMAKNPNDRYASAGEMALAIDKIFTQPALPEALAETPALGPVPPEAALAPLPAPIETLELPAGASGEQPAAGNGRESVASTPFPASMPFAAEVTPTPELQPLPRRAGARTPASVPSTARVLPPAARRWAQLGLAAVIILIVLGLSAALLSGTGARLLAGLAPAPAATPAADLAAALLPGPVIGGADKLAFIKADDLWVSNLDATGLAQLTRDAVPKASLGWTPDGDALLYIQGNCLQRLALGASAIEAAACFPENNPLKTMRFSPDGQRLALGFEDGSLYLLPYDLAALGQVKSLAGLAELAACPAWGPYQAEAAVRAIEWSSQGESLALVLAQPEAAGEGENGREIVRIIEIGVCSAPPVIRIQISAAYFTFSLRGYFNRPEILGLSWDGQGRLALNGYLRDGGFGDLFVYALDLGVGQAVNPVSGGCCYRDARWSPDGTYLLFTYQPEGSPAALYYTPYADIETGLGLAALPLPQGFLDSPATTLQPALRPASPPAQAAP